MLDAINAAHDPTLAYTTVMTVLGRLNDKGYVTASGTAVATSTSPPIPRKS